MREYFKDWSQALGRDMEVLRFGSAGLPLLVFPTSKGRFYQWEDFGLVGALSDKVEAGFIQLWCVDSVDGESWYADGRSADERVARHLQYERYLLDELMPRIPWRPVTTGTSFGAFHAVLLALRHPAQVNGFIGLSGAYDTDHWLDGQGGRDVYLTNPLAFLPGLSDESFLGLIRAMEKKVIATGQDDANVADSLRCGELLKEKGVDVWLDVWPGWAHDWAYWQEMMRRYV
ncbi:MAG: esterase [Actinomycetota bacterium]|nr:esterase [Actinomycetota bacterium]